MLKVRDAGAQISTDPNTGKRALVAYVSPRSVDVQQLNLAYRRAWPMHTVPTLLQPVQNIPRCGAGQVGNNKNQQRIAACDKLAWPIASVAKAAFQSKAAWYGPKALDLYM